MSLQTITVVGEYLKALKGGAAGRTNDARADVTDNSIFDP